MCFGVGLNERWEGSLGDREVSEKLPRFPGFNLSP